MLVKNWVACIDTKSEVSFSVWDNNWYSFISVKELIDQFGDRTIENVLIGEYDLMAEVEIYVAS